MKSEFIEGKTGHVAFDDLGDRLHAAYDVVNVQSSGEVTIGAYASDSLTVGSVCYLFVSTICMHMTNFCDNSTQPCLVNRLGELQENASI